MKYRRAVYVMTMKLFADMERKRRELEQRDMEERKRKREKEIEDEEKVKVDKEWQKNFEESREGRVSSWKTFQASKTKKSKGFFKPPKNKQEQRWSLYILLKQLTSYIFHCFMTEHFHVHLIELNKKMV